MTEHAYTGDNGLQRFVRSAAAAEQRVPFVYFGPLARVRDDELDLIVDPADLSKRSLTSDFFEGLVALDRIFATPMLFAKWIVGSNGKVAKVPAACTQAQLSTVYGDLVSLIEAVLWTDAAAIAAARAEVATLATKKNTTTSEVRFRLTRVEAADLMRQPAKLLGRMQGYFDKGKPHKLIARHAVAMSKVSVVRSGDNLITAKKDVSQILDDLAILPAFANGLIGYYSGYEWRPDPHSGVAANLYYRDCAPKGAPRLPLLLFYPRISVLEASAVALEDRKALTASFKMRYGTGWKKNFKMSIDASAIYSVWTVGTKQARVFTKYCALIVLNDGLVLGTELSKKWP